MSGTRVIGTCSLCGGAVAIPNAWWGVDPPIPQCASCDAVPVQCTWSMHLVEDLVRRGHALIDQYAEATSVVCKTCGELLAKNGYRIEDGRAA